MCFPGKFDAVKVGAILKESLYKDDDVLLYEYLEAYEEINKFFQLLGAVFGFVSNDIRSKIDILTTLYQRNPNFRSIKAMIVNEMDSNLFSDKKYISGSRTLLRLHRGLEFVFEFLLRVSKMEENEKLYTTCKSAYTATLAKYHPFLIRKCAMVAMYALPTKSELISCVCPNIPRSIDVLLEMLHYINCVYERVDRLYTYYNLHNLH